MSQKPDDIAAVKKELRAAQRKELPFVDGVFAALCFNHMPAIIDSHDKLEAENVAALTAASEALYAIDKENLGKAGRILALLLESPNPGQALLDELVELRKEIQSEH